MPTTVEYIEQYGNYSFEERPFCDADALALCQIGYMPLENVISERFSDEPVSFKEAADKIFAFRGNKHKNLGLMITSTPSKNIVNMGNTKRYASLKIVACKEVYSKNPAVQFAAMTFILPDGTVAVNFRGTNDDIAGWKEDVDLFLNAGSPSYTLALEYIENVAKAFDGDIIIMGHSKGGNVALYTALSCREETRKRIKLLYNHDGPGFADYEIFKTGSYDEILPNYRHYIPYSSFIGVLLAHDYDYMAVKSTKHLGPLQHDMGSWQVDGGEIVFVTDTDILSKVTDVWLAELVARVSNEDYRKAMSEVLTSITDSIQVRTLTEFVKTLPASLDEGIKGWKKTDKKTKDDFKASLKGSMKLLRSSVKAVRNGADVKELTRKCFEK